MIGAYIRDDIAPAIMRRRDLAPAAVRAEVVGLLFAHAETATARPLDIVDALRAADVRARLRGCYALANLLDHAALKLTSALARRNMARAA